MEITLHLLLLSALAMPTDSAGNSSTPYVSVPVGMEHLQPDDSESITRVVDFWVSVGPAYWFAKDPQFDSRFREQFYSLYERAAAGRIDHWATSSEGALALLILLDQYPRNAFRGTPRMYDTDQQARTLADAAIRNGFDLEIDQRLALFFYLPFAHSESLVDQDRSVALVERLGEPDISHARHHRDIIRRFGRFPHRNGILGRDMTPEEQRYLDEGGYSG